MKKRHSKFIGEIEFKPKVVKNPTKAARLAAQLAKKKPTGKRKPTKSPVKKKGTNRYKPFGRKY